VALRNMLDKFFAHFHAALAPVHQRRVMWLEVVVITLGVIAAGIFFEHDDPFQINGEFPWIWIAPLLIALRYGVPPGLVSSLILIAAWKLMDHLSETHESFPEQFFLGGLIMVMLCGEFSAAWGARLRRAEETNHYLDERLSRMTLRHLLLRLSHDRMEQEILTKPVTLRDALGGLRQLTAAQGDSSLPASLPLLQLLTQYCQLESAAIFVANEVGHYVRTSQIGSSLNLSANDPLLLYALEHRSLSHLLIEGLPDVDLPSPFLVVAPILASDKQVLGVLAIDRMPFLALNEENLQMLSVMLGYYADCVNEAEGARQFFKLFPDAPNDFAAEFSKLLHLQRSNNIISHVVVLSFANDENGRQAVAQLTHIRRGLDIPWQTSTGDRLLLVNLMPLANKPAVDGFLLRIETMLKEYMGADYDQWSLNPIRISLAESDPMASLKRVFGARHE
jgi:polysaccharide biosynthesis protein PelD